MRTIDADALERDGWQMSRTVRISKDTMEWQTRKPTDFPTIEPPRMRGKWETIEGWDGDEVYRCSECGEEYVLIDGTPKENGYHFCPNCGARMSEGEEDE